MADMDSTSPTTQTEEESSLSSSSSSTTPQSFQSAHSVLMRTRKPMTLAPIQVDLAEQRRPKTVVLSSNWLFDDNVLSPTAPDLTLSLGQAGTTANGPSSPSRRRASTSVQQTLSTGRPSSPCPQLTMDFLPALPCISLDETELPSFSASPSAQAVSVKAHVLETPLDVCDQRPPSPRQPDNLKASEVLRFPESHKMSVRSRWELGARLRPTSFFSRSWPRAPLEASSEAKELAEQQPAEFSRSLSGPHHWSRRLSTYISNRPTMSFRSASQCADTLTSSITSEPDKVLTEEPASLPVLSIPSRAPVVKRKSSAQPGRSKSLLKLFNPPNKA